MYVYTLHCILQQTQIAQTSNNRTYHKFLFSFKTEKPENTSILVPECQDIFSVPDCPFVRFPVRLSVNFKYFFPKQVFFQQNFKKACLKNEKIRQSLFNDEIIIYFKKEKKKKKKYSEQQNNQQHQDFYMYGLQNVSSLF